jgi:hypothetical protein
VRSILARYGPHPRRADDQSISTIAEIATIREQLCEGARLRGKVLTDLLDDDPPELLVAMFSEVHSAGHQFLNFDVQGHPYYDPAVAAAFGESPLRKVYETVDAEIGRLLQRLPRETTVLLAFLGGVCVTYGGSQLLGDLLVRMGITVPARDLRARMVGNRTLIPKPIRVALARRLPADVVARRSAAHFRTSIDWSRTRPFALPWT